MTNRLSESAQKEYLSRYYIDSYKIASQLHVNGVEIMDDERETLALTALEAAVGNFDPTKNVQFPTFLYHLIKNKVYDFAKKKNRAFKRGQPFSMQFVLPASQEDEHGSPDDAINDKALFHLRHGQSEPGRIPMLYEQLTEVLKTLSPRQQRIVECLMFPDEALAQYAAQMKTKVPRHLTYNIVAKMMSISYSSVNNELNEIRAVLKNTVDNSIF